MYSTKITQTLSQPSLPNIYPKIKSTKTSYNHEFLNNLYSKPYWFDESLGKIFMYCVHEINNKDYQIFVA